MRGLSRCGRLELPLGLSCSSHRMPFVLQIQIRGRKLVVAATLTVQLEKSSPVLCGGK